jgi:2-amino-4-hydroxy-6-hydroxymethyldihydropteridine diphosphokinase
MSSEYILIGLGANLGDPIQQLMVAKECLAASMTILGASSLYRSAPIDCPLPQEDYWNAVLLAETNLTPYEVLSCFHHIENNLGRQREGYHSARTIDIDLLMYGSLVINDEVLSIPHPRLFERAFVLRPLHEVLPELSGIRGISIKVMLDRVSMQLIECCPSIPGWKVGSVQLTGLSGIEIAKRFIK